MCVFVMLKNLSPVNFLRSQRVPKCTSRGAGIDTWLWSMYWSNVPFLFNDAVVDVIGTKEC